MARPRLAGWTGSSLACNESGKEGRTRAFCMQLSRELQLPSLLSNSLCKEGPTLRLLSLSFFFLGSLFISLYQTALGLRFLFFSPSFPSDPELTHTICTQYISHHISLSVSARMVQTGRRFALRPRSAAAAATGIPICK